MDVANEPQAGQTEQYSGIIAKASLDVDFRRRLIDDPATTLRAEGVVIPPGAEVQVVESSEGVAYVVLPRHMEENELSDADLAQIAGGRITEAQIWRAYGMGFGP